MKYLKTFENINEPKVGDYIIVKYSFIINIINNYKISKDEMIDFLSSNVGQIIRIEKYPYLYYVKFDDNSPFGDEIHYDEMLKISSGLILDFSPSKELLQLKLDSKKYNL